MAEQLENCLKRAKITNISFTLVHCRTDSRTVPNRRPSTWAGPAKDHFAKGEQCRVFTRNRHIHHTTD